MHVELTTLDHETGTRLSWTNKQINKFDRASYRKIATNLEPVTILRSYIHVHGHKKVYNF